jgi:hypothetical protein
MEKSCEGCKHWRVGDLTPKGIGNVGQCNVLMAQTAGFYSSNKRSPFWAQHLSFQTASYEGTGCNTYKEKKGD